MVSVPTCTHEVPSVFVSQCSVSAVCNGAPLFCMMMQVTTFAAVEKHYYGVLNCIVEPLKQGRASN